PPYDTWTDEEHCRKAKTRQDFLNIVKDLVRHPDETRRLAREAHEHVIRERCIAREAETWREAVSP
ncbi:MAG: glycosyltransferase, partial [Gemmatimonadaceae bacterium]|nr:glycosyltransferase [Gemmatimonadaceae bacterium]